MKKLSMLLLALVVIFLLRPSANAQTIVAQDDCEAYSGGNYTDENQGSGFSGAFQFRAFGVNDQGGEFIETGTRKISGNQSFGIYANTTGTGKAVSRSFSSALSGLHRVSFRVRFDLNTNNGLSAGFVICDTDVGSQSMWNTGQRLYLGISGDGLWKYDDGTLKTVTISGGNFACTGGDIYLVELDFNATSGNSYALRITNETAASTSDIMSGTLAGTANAAILSIGFGNGVTGNTQNLIFDDIVVTQNPANPLPVELTSFTAKAQPDGVLLQWETASELNNDYFEIGHSQDMRLWQALGKVQGAGTTLSNSRYEFLHPSPGPGVNYYRLRQVDFNGQERLSEVVVFEWKAALPMRAFPNPFSEVIGVSAPGLPEGSGLLAELIDVNGKAIETWKPGQEGLHALQVPSGVYLLRVSKENGRVLLVQKMVKH